MGKKKELTREVWIERIRASAAKHEDGHPRSGDVNITLNQLKLHFCGSWAEACRQAGVEPKSKVVKHGTNGGYGAKTRLANVSQGEEVAPQGKMPQPICWNCARSAAPVRYRCSWDAALVMPQGAKYVALDVAQMRKGGKQIITQVYRVVECPKFVRENAQTRAAKLQERMDERHKGMVLYKALAEAGLRGMGL